MNAGFTITRNFGPQHGEWSKWIAWSGLAHVTEVVGLDQMLSAPRPRLGDDDEIWLHLVEPALPHVFVRDRDWLLAKHAPNASEQLLYVVANGSVSSGPRDFVRAGFELLERGGSISALTNCGGFPAAFARDDLNALGLVTEMARARRIQDALSAAYPNDPHAIVDVFEIWREPRGP